MAGIFLSVPAVRGGQAAAMPQWYPFEMKAINLYEMGISQESSNPQAALTTLQQARHDSTEAIANGGGGNAAVRYNDQLIGRALATAQADAAKPAETNKATATQKSSRINLVRAGGSHSQAVGKLR